MFFLKVKGINKRDCIPEYLYQIEEDDREIHERGNNIQQSLHPENPNEPPPREPFPEFVYGNT
jgi:hypothetical protein